MRPSGLNPGDTFGHLTLVEKLPEKDKHGSYLWRCVCECGQEKITPSSKVRKGLSCGCVALACREASSLVGQKFGRLLVIKRLEETTIHRCRKYLCRCDCGKEKILPSSDLRNWTKSCGCLAAELGLQKLPYGEGSFNQLYSSYRFGAKRRKIPFKLSRDEFRQLTQLDCYYCGESPKQIAQGCRHNGPYVYNGVDRLDSSKGYKVENCVPCCGICNRMKYDISHSDFMAQIRRILKRHDG